MPSAHPRKSVVTFLRTYRVLPERKDPIIDAVHTLLDDAGMSVAKLHERSGVAATTYKGWFDGPTRQPQHSRVAATLRALGYEFAIVPFRTKLNGRAINASAPQIIRTKLDMRGGSRHTRAATATRTQGAAHAHVDR